VNKKMPYWVGLIEIQKSNGIRSYEGNSSDSNEQSDNGVSAGYEHEWKGIKNEELWTVIERSMG